MNYTPEKEFAQQHDEKDPLRAYQEQFHFPVRNQRKSIYFCGNSLGLQPKTAQKELETELASWRENGVEGHFEGQRPWVSYHQQTKPYLAKLVGAHEHEVVSMNNLTSNLHLMLASFYQPNGKRVKLLIEGGAFPSDHYAAESHMKRMGINPKKHLVTITPQQGDLFTTEEIVRKINSLGEELALVMLPGVQYYTGQFFDMKAISSAAHEVGAFAGFDLAHAVGNLPMNLHEDGMDFAAWCSYKYLNSGPGGVSGVFIHERHGQNASFPRLTGWWGHDHQTRFKMDNQFVPNPGVDGWMLSNVNVLSTAVHLASLKIFDEADINRLRKKSIHLTGYLEYLLSQDALLSEELNIITPKNPEERGCQLSISMKKNGRKVFDGLTEKGVILDWREPNVIRVAPTPLYNSYSEVWEFYQILKQLVADEK